MDISRNLPIGIQSFEKLRRDSLVFAGKAFRDYWFATGTPTFLV